MSLTPKLLQQGAAGSARANYIEDVFSTFLYTGSSSARTITNGIDLATYGGMVWCKSRVSGDGSTYNNILMDTARGTGSGNILYGNLTLAAQTAANAGISSFNSNGFSLRYDDGYGTNYPSGGTFASWTFRKQAKFFDIVTYTGNGVAGRNITHNLGSVPGCIIIKMVDFASPWFVYHRSLGNTAAIQLQSINAAVTATSYWNNTSPTSTQFTLGTQTNTDTANYVAYIFAHDSGGFGLTGNDNVISCGTFNGNTTVNLGYEPQFVLVKSSDVTDGWYILDNMRGWTNNGSSGNDNYLFANTSGTEVAGSSRGYLTATGFTTNGYAGATGIYIAIRRGPMKVPTVASSVFSLAKVDASTVGGGISMLNGDMALYLRDRFSGKNSGQFFDRLRGFPQAGASSPALRLNINNSQEENISSYVTTSGFNSSYSNCPFQASDNIMRAGFSGNSSEAGSETSGASVYGFRRAPGFFDIVCYKGTYPTATQNVSHNLGVIPQLIMCKQRDSSGSFYVSTFNNGTLDKSLLLNFAIASPSSSIATTSATSTYFVANNADGGIGNPNGIMVAYLFATLPGISKVGSYIGNGSTQTINCGFSAGARFVLIKRTDSTGNWYVFDTARGIIAGNDPLFYLNLVNAEDSTYDVVDPDNSGFIINNNDPYHTLNAASATYIFLAIA